jgi:hypothetical protein
VPAERDGAQTTERKEAMCNLKAFALALTAIIATCAIAATAAAANQFHSAASETTATVSATTTQSFQYEGAHPIECAALGGAGEISKAQTASELKFLPTYSSCKVFFGSFEGSVQVLMNSCKYLYTIEASGNKGPVHIRCPEGQ